MNFRALVALRTETLTCFVLRVRLYLQLALLPPHVSARSIETICFMTSLPFPFSDLMCFLSAFALPMGGQDTALSMSPSGFVPRSN